MNELDVYLNFFYLPYYCGDGEFFITISRSGGI